MDRPQGRRTDASSGVLLARCRRGSTAHSAVTRAERTWRGMAHVGDRARRDARRPHGTPRRSPHESTVCRPKAAACRVHVVCGGVPRNIPVMPSIRSAVVVVTLLCSPVAAPQAMPMKASPPTPVAAERVAAIRRADYEGDRSALLRLASEVDAVPDDAGPAARTLYWKGFALWRRAINGFNEEQPDPGDLERDLQGAIVAFREAERRDPSFLDGAIGRYSCLSLIGFLHGTDRERLMSVAEDLGELAATLRTAAADNPRWIWVVGQNEFVAAPGTSADQREERRARVLANYERGLALAREAGPRTTDPLEPTWGEPELLMSLAWSRLNQTTPDLVAAERHAREALALVPNWHYVRDILLPQIIKASQK